MNMSYLLKSPSPAVALLLASLSGDSLHVLSNPVVFQKVLWSCEGWLWLNSPKVIRQQIVSLRAGQELCEERNSQIFSSSQVDPALAKERHRLCKHVWNVFHLINNKTVIIAAHQHCYERHLRWECTCGWNQGNLWLNIPLKTAEVNNSELNYWIK